MYKSGYVTRADLDQLEAAQKTAQAQVESSRAQLTHDLANLNFSVIRSPVNGVVISRNVDVGQTVAASFQTPTLFQIGENLKKMQIDVTVDESDIGLIKVGQRAVFTVDAYPSQSFTGRVAQIRLNATIVQNVVTYDVVVNFDNPKEQLLPGMTAYVNIVIATRNHVVTVPNAALRVRLPLKVKPIAVKGKGATGLIYVLRKSGPEAISVKTGLTNGIRTEIVRGAVKPGQKVIVGIKTNSSATGRRRSVFGGH